MSSPRPDPDRLLEELNQARARARRGRLRIFFGAAAGVGKTFSMLEAAHVARNAGVDIVIGYVEPHGRPDTERLLKGIENLPFLTVRYRDMVRREFDLDAALARRPSIVVVDELAHSNLTGGEPKLRHAKRWQDIEELRDAGVDVWTTLNVQHLESLNDIVAGITGVRQQETIPDHIFDEADQIELIDLPPDELLARLRAGKVYLPEMVTTAVERFFRLPNLNALRELALRRTADRVEAAARAAEARDPATTARARDRLMVAVGPDAQAPQLVRAGKRMADALDAEWTVVYVETPALLRLREEDRNRRIAMLRLAESLGAEAVTLDGPSAAEALLEYARTRGATRLLVGDAKRRGWRALLRRSTTTELARRARGLDVIVVANRDAARPDQDAARRGAPPLDTTIHWSRYVWALVSTALCTGLAFLMYPRVEPVNLVMVYLLGATVVGLRLGRGPSIVAAVANVAAFDFCFVPPRYSFAVTDVQYLITFGVMLTVALVIANLMASVRQQTRVAGARERRTAVLYAMSRELSSTRGGAAMGAVAARHIADTFAGRTAILVPDESGRLAAAHGLDPPWAFGGADQAIAQWVYAHGKPAGTGTDTLPAAGALYLPLIGSSATLGVLVLEPARLRRILLPEQRHLLDTFAGQTALALERARLAEAAEAARVDAERESLRNTLLTSISHDLRTPLAVIAGAASTLAADEDRLDPASRVRLARSIESHAGAMSELVSNVLDLMRLESGEIKLRLEDCGIDDLVGAALPRIEGRLTGHYVEVALPDDLPAVHVDAALLAQVFANLLENAGKYTPPGTHVRIGAHPEGTWVRVWVEDDGAGLPAGDPMRLFDKFHRGRNEGVVPGVGLGLTLCRAIVTAHGGAISAGERPGGGARFEFTLPAASAAPSSVAT
jgi:two-component system sensor histidine kinase KdpD